MTEDLTTYTQVGDLTVTAAKVYGYFGRDVNRYLYKDVGTGKIDAINLMFEGAIADSDPYGYYSYIYMGVSNVVDDASGWNTTDTIQVSLERAGGYGEGAYWVSLSNPYDSSFDSCLISPGVTYYFTLSRLPGSDIATLGVFSDAARTTLVDTLTISGLGTKTWRYFYAAATYNDGTADYYASGFYQNFLFLTGAGGGAQIIGLSAW